MRKCPQGNPLHTRMHFKHGAYWYVFRGKWVRLGADYAIAMQSYAAKIAPAGGMEKLIDDTYQWYADRVERGELTARSFRQYQMVRERISTAFVEFSPNQVKPSHIASFLDFYFDDTQGMGNIALTVLSAMFKKGVRWGLNDFNPARDVERFKMTARSRYITDDEFLRIRKAAPEWMRLIIDMCYLTAQRIGDVLHIKQADITSEGILFEQQKTRKRLLVESSPELNDLVRDARGLSKIAGVYLFARSASLPRHYSSVRRAWIAACEAAGVEGAVMHDIRAKSLTDADAEGKDAQKLAGHASRGMTERYLRLLRTDRVQSPAKFRQV